MRMTAIARSVSRTLFPACLVMLAACENMPPPPPVARPVEEVMQYLTLFADPVAMLGERPPGSVKDAAEYYLQLFQPGIQLPRIFETTRIYDRTGILLADIFNEGRRTGVPIDQILPNLIDATIATEDSTFLVNGGIDPRRMVGAAIQNVEARGVVSGARALFLLPNARYDQSLERKSLKVELARQLSLRISKDEILEMYLNLLNYGHLTHGPEAAAQAYFGKSAADLSLAEASLLAGIPQQPANPDLFVNFEAAKERQSILLALMVRHGFLSQEEVDAAYGEEVVLNPAAEGQGRIAPHFVNFVLDPLESRLGEQYVRRAGLHVYTAIDLALQDAAQAAVSKAGASDAGQFDFPLYSATPQTLYLTVQADSGVAISPAISPAIPVPHNVDGASFFPCVLSLRPFLAIT